MDDSPLSVLIEHTFSRSDAAYRIGVLKEFLEYVYFTKNSASATKDLIEPFDQVSHKPAADIAFLKNLPVPFLASFERDSFYGALDHLSTEAQALPALSLSVPYSFDRSQLDAIGTWARRALGASVLLDISIDPSIGIGCQIVWKDHLYDFGFDHYIAAHRRELEMAVNQRVRPPDPASI